MYTIYYCVSVQSRANNWGGRLYGKTSAYHRVIKNEGWVKMGAYPRHYSMYMYIYMFIHVGLSLSVCINSYTFSPHLQSIKRVIDRRTVDLYALFSDELNLVKKEFTRQAPSLPASQPHHAGRATWARRLKRRIDVPMKVSWRVDIR